eukprot:30294-Pelagococcus_subviridis.AAC.39
MPRFRLLRTHRYLPSALSPRVTCCSRISRSLCAFEKPSSPFSSCCARLPRAQLDLGPAHGRPRRLFADASSLERHPAFH